MGAASWTITELAQEFDTTLRSIRFYEDRGLLSPERVGQSRVFHPRDRAAQAAGAQPGDSLRAHLIARSRGRTGDR